MTAFAPDIEILVVEDEPLIGYELVLTFEEAGAKVIGPITTLAAALSIIANSTPSVAILDVRLGEDEVGPAAAALAAKGVPFVFHTGHGNMTALAPWRERPIIHKPAPPEAIVAAVLEVLASGSPVPSNSTD